LEHLQKKNFKDTNVIVVVVMSHGDSQGYVEVAERTVGQNNLDVWQQSFGHQK
jgi:hypothetical protein